MTAEEKLRSISYCQKEFVKTCIDTFFMECRIKNLSPVTVELYAERLRYLMEYLDDHGVDLERITHRDLKNYILSRIDELSPHSINSFIRVHKVFFRVLRDEGLFNHHPAERIKCLKAPRKIKKVLTPENVSQMLKVFDRTTYFGMRNYAMVLVLWDCMLRRAELLGLRREDVNLSERYLKVMGKGSKERIAPFGPKTAKALMVLQRRFLRSIPSQWQFCYNDGSQMKERHLNQALERSSVPIGRKVNPHLLRHSAATWFIKSGGSPVILQHILGHSSLAVTERYLHILDHDVAKSTHNPSSALL